MRSGVRVRQSRRTCAAAYIAVRQWRRLRPHLPSERPPAWLAAGRLNGRDNRRCRGSWVSPNDDLICRLISLTRTAAAIPKTPGQGESFYRPQPRAEIRMADSPVTAAQRAESEQCFLKRRGPDESGCAGQILGRVKVHERIDGMAVEHRAPRVMGGGELTDAMQARFQRGPQFLLQRDRP